MAVGMKITAGLSLLITVVCGVLFMETANDILLTLTITFGTTAYHFLMRLLVGTIVNGILHNKVNHSKIWFRVSKTEQKIYVWLKVKNWKNKMPTYDETLFNRHLHSWVEIVQAMCQSEIVHEIIVVLSFLPIVFAVWFGAFPVFAITSVLAAGFDLAFVVLQRYNRPRVIKLIQKGACANEKSI
ncbi:MAG: hypothetical protein E7462_05760 [Ruminococcaceae bacterium]|nr:hypothetical protein [Oscillospiraceae bacterium]